MASPVFSETVNTSNVYCFSGYGQANIDGTYRYNGQTRNGQPEFENDNGLMFIFFAFQPTWHLQDIGQTKDWWFSSDNTTGILGIDTWGNETGDNTEGTISLCEITEENDTEIDWGSATTTNQMLGSINFGLAILIVFFMIGFSGYVWNKFGNKKPWLR